MPGEVPYLAIDLKSFYASVECVDRGLDPLQTHLVVADQSRTDKTICLAVTPSLKALGVKGRPRLFEVVEDVRCLNADRRKRAPGRTFTGASWKPQELAVRPDLAIDYLVAPPRMARYIEVSSKIYGIYLDYVAPEDIHVYSIDEVFMAVGPYLHAYGGDPRAMTRTILQDVIRHTGITATAGIGTNLYLAKVAMDIVAKKKPADAQGVRMAVLDERAYRQVLWSHTPITDFWQVGPGIARRLAKKGLATMGDVALCALKNEAMLYANFGINAELLIDHAWGHESCTMADIKAYTPQSRSLGVGQVLHRAYRFDEGRIAIQEMADQLALDLLAQGLVTRNLVLAVSYDGASLASPDLAQAYQGPISQDAYGRPRPKSVRGTEAFPAYTASGKRLVQAALSLYDRLVDPRFLVRRLQVTCGDVAPKDGLPRSWQFTQPSLFDQDTLADIDQEEALQEAILAIKKAHGKNALIKGTSLQAAATMQDRNRQIGGHRA